MGLTTIAHFCFSWHWLESEFAVQSNRNGNCLHLQVGGRGAGGDFWLPWKQDGERWSRVGGS